MPRSVLLWFLLCLMLFAGAASAQTNCTNCFALNLNATPVPVTAVNFTNDSLLATTGTGEWSVTIGAGSPAALPPGTYTAWCFSDPSQGPDFQDTYKADSIMVKSGSPLANEVNYILNHKQGVTGYPPPTAADVQVAIWILLDGASTLQNTYGIVPSPSAAALVAAASSTAGQTYVPPPGGTMGVVLTPPGTGDQPLLIEIKNPCAALGDFVWNDSNMNGVQDTSEAGINGVTVQLTDTLGNVLATTTTAATPAWYTPVPQYSAGWYQFSGLSPSCSYRVSIPSQSALNGLTPDTSVCTGNTANGCSPSPSAPVLFSSPNNLVDENLDFGYYSQPLTLACSSTNAGEADVYFDSGPMTVTGGTGPYSFFVAGGTMPSTLTLDTSTGEVTGTPTGPASFSLGVKDHTGAVATGNCPIVIAAGPALSCSGTSSGIVGKLFNSGPMTVTGGSGSYTFFVASGTMPDGLSLNTSNGAVSGTPNAAGSFTLGVKDSKGSVASGACPITILPAISADCVSITAVRGIMIAPVTMTATGGTGSGYMFQATGLPNGLIMSSGGTISGIPQVSGTFPYTVTITDSGGNTGTAHCSVTVTAPASIAAGDTATIGFWNNKNGQAVINSLNGGPTATALGNWLASTFPYLYGPTGANLGGKTNADVAAYFQSIFKVKGQKTSAQIMAGALACYVTNTSLAGSTYAGKFGFNLSSTGSGVKVWNVGSDGTSVGLQNGTSYTVLQLLLQVNLSIQNGTYSTYENGFNVVFSDINQQGDIS